MPGRSLTIPRTAAATRPGWPPERKSLAGACLVHLLHDGYTDLLYVLLPVWQPEFGLSYAGVALVRALYSVTMGALQIPADTFTARLGARAALVLATLIAAAGYAVAALPMGFPGLCAGLVIAGIGSSIQHPRASMLVTTTFEKSPRGPLSIYNFAGDMGKAIFPASVALLLPLAAWRPVVALMALIGVLAAAALLALLPHRAMPAGTAPVSQASQPARQRHARGFTLLLAIGALDTATRMGYLLFLPFLLHAKGGGASIAGIGLALLFAGGALGKATCGWLGQRLGVVPSVILTEAATALFMLATLRLPLAPVLIALPLLGIVLNGTSSILYGTVPELAAEGQASRAFALFYTGVIGAGGLAPILYGAIADHAGQTAGVVAAALTACAIVPMAWALRQYLGK